MDQNSTPDAWDQGDDVAGGDRDNASQIADDLAKLNVNAVEFVPGKNVFAKAFAMPGAVEVSVEVSVQDTEEVTIEANCTEKMEEEAPDDWAEKEDGSGSQTPEDSGGGANGSLEGSEEKDMDEESEEEEDEPAPIPKKRLVSTSATKKPSHLNIVFIGHVDAGKSTIGGHIMFLTGMVDKRTMEKYEREAKELNRESWYLSWALDTNAEERDKGKTVEVGRAFFETDERHFTILDAPGHKSFVPNMIGGASQADVAVLVISARRGEFETGFERGGQTREHAMLVKTAGVRHLIVAVNKMDDPTVEWDVERFNEIKDKLTPYLKKCGFNPKTDLYYLPVSGYTGVNLKDCNREICPWYNGPSLLTYLDELPEISRMADGPVRMPVVDRYKDMGTLVLGKVESGTITKGQILMLMPNRISVEVMSLWTDDDEVDESNPGENLKLKLRNVEEEDVSPGFVLCSPNSLCHTGRLFDAQIVILEHKSIICAGYSAVMHIHCSAEEVTIKHLLCLVDRKTGEKSKTRPRFIKQDQIAIVRLWLSGGVVCMETFKDFPQMGRFTLRDEGRTICIGKVLKVLE